MTSTITTRVKTRSEPSRRAHSPRPGAGRRSGHRGNGTSAASRKAYDRRKRRGSGMGAGAATETALRFAGPRELARRIPFVVFVMLLFLAGIGITLWLTTNATARSYQIADAHQQNTRLEDTKESLMKIVQAGNSAPELARKAAELGMVQSEDVARLVVAPDGSVTVHGEPKPAEGPKPGDLARVPAVPDTVAPSAGAPSAQGVLPPADAAPIPPADATVMAVPAPPGERAADTTPPATPAEGPAQGVLPPADAAPIPPADAARGADGPAGAPAEGAH
ncbi:hypothetical protein [Tomitella cavernea]|uniref:Cell division protein FtsL n=1 Tax=Tomitella cavernea TaxID=1387982 RepID=A0ABP9CTK8_9ACTN